MSLTITNDVDHDNDGDDNYDNYNNDDNVKQTRNRI